MPVLVVSSPNQPDQVVDLGDRALVLGRDPGCDVPLADPKVSSRHLRVAPRDAGGWMVQDLESTHGTRVGKRRVLRTVLKSGDVVHVGETRLRFLPAAPAAAGEAAEELVGGTLQLRRVPLPDEAPPLAPPKPPSPIAAPPGPATEVGLPDVEHETVTVYRPLDPKSLSRALVFLVLGCLVVAGVELLLAPGARVAEERADERRALRDALERMDISPETFQMEIQDFLAEHPSAPESEALLHLVAQQRALEASRVTVEGELMRLMGGLHGLPESEARARLLELQRTLPLDQDIADRAREALGGLNERHDRAEGAALEATLAAATELMGHEDPAGALRRLGAFRAAWPSLAPDALQRLRSTEDRAIAAAVALQERALTTARAEGDEVERRRILATAWRGLAGLPQAEQVADALRFTRTPGQPSSPGATPAVPGTPRVPEGPTPAEQALLAKAAAAEDMVRGRRWGEALVALKELIDGSDPGLLQREWLARSDEVRLVLGLVERLGERAQGKDGLRVRLPAGGAEVLGADEEGADLRIEGRTRRVAWGDVDDADLLPLLSPPKPTPRHRLGLAVLAAGLSLRDEMIAFLVPLFEEERAVAEASGIVARYIDGRAEPPPGGYRAYKGQILDRQRYDEKVTEERRLALRAEAEGLLAKVKKENAFKKLAKLAKLREELDKRRYYALLAIFNEKHYPYPANKASQQYQAVQKEIDARVEAVREVWDDPLKVKIARKGSLGKHLDAWDTALASLKRLGEDVTTLDRQMSAYASYVTGEPITIREYARDAAEQKLLAYNRWVMNVYNPKQDREATEAERKQTRVTNDYRVMMGFATAVTPGPAPYEAIDRDNVVKVLDEGRNRHRLSLNALRIDDRLVRSSRAHSLDMQRRGFFAHKAPANPATGEPATHPWDRMKREDYQGRGASENIANGASSPEQAHWMWIHSSGHHRNILSVWEDQGVGKAGRLWTQNFGSRGGKPAEIEAETTPGDEAADAEAGGDGSPRR